MISLFIIIYLMNFSYCSCNDEVDLFEYEPYFEETKNVLYGLETPIFLARLNSTEEFGDNPEIIYDRYYYPLAGQEMKFNNFSVDEISDSYYDYKTESTSDTVYPEILVVVDYETYEAFNRNVALLATYMASFWHGVDLRFRQMCYPKVRLNIAGIVIPTHTLTEPYLNNLNHENTDVINYENYIDSILNNISYHFDMYFSNAYDIVFTIIRRSSSFSGLPGLLSGASYQTGACKGYLSSAIIDEAGSFDGITAAAHELGHLFGAREDDYEHLCSWDDGYIMTDKWGTNNKTHWSKCSIKSMQYYLSKAKCFKNMPKINIPHAKRLPGKVLNGSKQCQSLYPGKETRFVENDNCNVLQCQECDLMTCKVLNNHYPPAEGTSCKEKFYCLDGLCVKEPNVYH